MHDGVPMSVQAQLHGSPPEGFSAEGLAQLNAALSARVESAELAGVVAVVSLGHGRRVVLSHGYADLARALPMTHDTPVRMYSMSKPLTAALALRLCELAVWELDTEVARFVPALSQLAVFSPGGVAQRATRRITIRHLLTHTAGFVYPNPGGNAVERLAATAIGGMHGDERDLTLAEYVTRLSAAPLAHEPGEAFCYGVAMDVLAHVAERATGLSFDALLRRELLDPLAMHDTGFFADPRRSARVYGRAGAGGPLVPMWPDAMEIAEPPRFLSGGGGIVSTAADYARFCELLLGEGERAGERLLSPESVRAMRACHVPTWGSPRAGPECGVGCAHGLGVRVVVQPGGGYGELGAFGWDGLAGTTFFVDPARRFTALLTTQIAPWPVRLHEEFRKLAYLTLA